MENEGQNYWEGGMDFSVKLSTGIYTKLNIVLCTYLFYNGETKVGNYQESEGIHKRDVVEVEGDEDEERILN